MLIMGLSGSAGCSADNDRNQNPGQKQDGGNDGTGDNDGGDEGDTVGKDPSYTTQLGANFNENIYQIENVTPLLNDAKIEWVRSFVSIPLEFLKKSNQTITGVKDDAALQAYTETLDFIKVKEQSGGDIKLVMSLKLPFGNFTHSIPPLDSPITGYFIEACRKFLLLHDLGKNIDILVLGNEPMWENKYANEDNDDLYVEFIRLLASKVDEWKTEYDWDFKVFGGALNRISLNVNSNRLIKKLVAEVNENELIDGLDLHIHALDFSEVGNSLRIVREDLGMKKEIIVTEFSMVWLYGEHLNDNLGNWGANNGYTSGTKMYQWLNNAVDMAEAGTPISADEYESYFGSRAWFPKNWFRNFYAEFLKYDVLCVMTRFSSELKTTDVSDGRYDTSSKMWDLNAIYSSKLLGTNPQTGLMNRNPMVWPDYREIAEKRFGVKME